MLIIKSVKSAELLILLISVLSYFLETLKALCTEKAWVQISMLTEEQLPGVAFKLLCG